MAKFPAATGRIMIPRGSAQVRIENFLQSNKSWAARVYLPATALIAAILLLYLHPTYPMRPFFATAVLLSPVVFIGWWTMFVLVEVEAKPEESSVIIRRWRSSRVVEFDDIESITIGYRLYLTMLLKNGEKLHYVRDEHNESLLHQTEA